MKLLLAAYDPSVESDVGNYWAWSHPSISRTMLDTMYYDVIASRRPENPNTITKDDVVGGCCSLSDDHCFWYRIFNGDRDRNGRPGRFVAVVALLNSREIKVCGWNTFLTSPLMRLFAEDATSIPLPTPSSFEIDWNEPVTIASDELRNRVNGKQEVSLAKLEVGPTLELIAETPNLNSFHLTLVWDDKKVLTVLRSDSLIQLLIHDLKKEHIAASPSTVIMTNASATQTKLKTGNQNHNWIGKFFARETVSKTGWKDWAIIVLTSLLILALLVICLLVNKLFLKTDERTITTPTVPMAPEKVEPAATSDPPTTRDRIRDFVAPLSGIKRNSTNERGSQ